MLIIQCLVYSALAFITTTVSQRTQYQLNFALNLPLQFDNSELSKHSLFSLHKDLVNIESISGNEQALGEYLEAYLKSHNYTVERQYVHPLPSSLQNFQTGEVREQKQRFNLLAYPGEKRQTPVLLSSVSALSEPSSPFLYHLLSLKTRCKSKGADFSVLKLLRYSPSELVVLIPKW